MIGSNWFEEKTSGRIAAQSVRSVGIKDIREGGVETVESILEPLGPENPVVLNATELNDMDVAVTAILELVKSGKEFVFRTAASFVQSLAALAFRWPRDPSVRLCVSVKNRWVGSYLSSPWGTHLLKHPQDGWLIDRLFRQNRWALSRRLTAILGLDLNGFSFPPHLFID